MDLRTTLSTAGAVARLLPNLPRMTPGARVSPSTLLAENARRHGRELALAFGTRRYTWQQMDEEAARWAGWLHQQGIRKGEVVALDMDNRPEFLFAVHGLSKLGAVAALINTHLADRPLEHAIQVSGARRVLAGSEHREKVRDALKGMEGLSPDDLWVHLDEGDEAPGDTRVVNDEIAGAEPFREPPEPVATETFCYIYTSGTTGLPKAAIISNQRMLIANIGFGVLMHRSAPGDVIYVPLPLYHSSAMFLGWGAALSTGAGVALRRRFSASNFWKDVRGYDATSFLYIGELCRYLLNRPHEPGERNHRLRVGVGNGLRPDIWEAFQERFGVPVIREFYGATEGNTAILNLEGKPGMIGRKMFGQAVIRCDLETGEPFRDQEGRCEAVETGQTGLLLGRISKATRFDGYVDEQATEKKILRDVFKEGDAWFNTGDLVKIHEGNWLSFADRVGDTFRWKGENVSTNEVAEVVNEATGVLEANVYGVRVPNADGRAGMAALRVDEQFDIDALSEHVRERLAPYQRPLFVRLLEDMQVTSTLKHRKVEYREQGYDPDVVPDPLYVLEDGRYQPLDAERHAPIERGELVPG